MGLIDNARYASIERGFDYYKSGKVISFKQVGEFEYDGKVSGSMQKPYDVHIDTVHLKKSLCNCPFAEGNRKVCKHKIAIYFSAFPDEAEEYRRKFEEDEEYDDDYEFYDDYDEFDDDDYDEDDNEKLNDDFRKFICDIINERISKMTKSEAQSALYDIMGSAPDRVLLDFINNWVEMN